MTFALDTFSEFEPLQELETWALEFQSGLSEIEKDLNLILDLDLNIYIAVDFYDLILHVFPEEKILSGKDDSQELKRAVSRQVFFDSVESFYNYPIILLPPYISEINDFYFFSSNKMINLGTESQGLKSNILNILNKIKSDMDFNEKLNALEKSALYLYLYYSEHYMKGETGLRKLLREKSSPNPKEIPNYLDLVSDIKYKDNVYYNAFKRLRPASGIQNIRDSKAVHYIAELNKTLYKDGIIIYILSSSKIFSKFNDEGPLFINIKGEDYDLIKNVDSFYYLALEMYFSLGINIVEEYNEDLELNLHNLELGILRKNIRYQLALVRSFSNMSEQLIQCVKWGTLSGIYLQWVDKLLRFKYTIEKLEKDILLAYIGEHSKEGSISNLDGSLGNLIVQRLEDLRRDIANDSFLVELNKRIRDLQNEQEDCANWILDEMDYRASSIVPEFGLKNIGCLIDYKFYYNLMNKDYMNKILKRDESSSMEIPHVKKLRAGVAVLYDKGEINKNLYIIIHEDANILRIYEFNMETLYRSLLENENLDPKSLDLFLNKPTIRILELLLNYETIPYIYKNEIANLLKKLKGYRKTDI